MSTSTTKTYDVFISFRGEDTRRGFTNHLYSALRQASIKTYIDNNNLEKGDEVWPALSKAIEESHIAIVVFSEKYASSKWCLKELVKILECRKDKSHRQVVIPVFYEADPSHIRKQTGSYGEAFSKHERVLRENSDNESIQKNVPQWKAALTEAANISGWDSRNFEKDSEVIEKIVKDVSQKLSQRYPTELKVEGLVGIEEIGEHIQYLLAENTQNQLLKNVKVIGIWGMGGIGKTTIASAVFSQLFPLYDSVCFLANIRELSKNDRPSKLSALSDRLLSELLKEEIPKFNVAGSTFFRSRIGSKKVFIVLDDVNSLNQLDVLCRECEYAAPGSKLIITTRNRHLLVGRADEIYDATPWSFDESLELFCLHAFKQRRPQEGYEDLSKTAVHYAGGVPLALKVLGSNLYSRSTGFWDSELKRVKNYPYDGIENVLRVSYDGLGPLEKEIFLDIAFFFKDENKDFVKRILNVCGFHATSGIEDLKDKALITISTDERIQMHDLLQEMGLNIVCQDIKDPGKRSRLRGIEEVYDVLQNRKGTDAVEGIILDLSHIDYLLSLSEDTFNMMTELRFLKLYIPLDKRAGKLDYPRVLNKISDNLRYLEWHGCGLKSLPATFSAKMLVQIRLPHSHVTELWQGVKDVVNLEGIDLSESKELKNLPDLSLASKLKWVNLTGCESLLAVHPSLLSLDTLETLILDGCKKLENLKSEKHIRSLKKISVNGCTSLKEFSVSSDLIRSLDLSKTGVEKLHPSIGNLTRLMWLNLEGLRLRNLPNELSSLKSLEDLRISNCRVGFLKSLWDLRISNCRPVIDRQKLHVLFDGLTSLLILHLKDCCDMYELPDNISGLSHLYELRLDGSNVETLPESIKHLDSLVILSVNNCRKLWCLPKLPPFIREFNAVNCSSLVTLSTLKTFAEVMKGTEKYISFQNCINLDEPSLSSIMEGAQLSMMSAVFQNVLVRKYGVENHGFNYNSMKICWAGSSVPAQFTYRTTHSSILIKPPSDSNMLGIVLCAVLSPSPGIKKHGAKIFCQCYLDGREVGYATKWDDKSIGELNCDHVYMWYDALHFDSTVRSHGQYLSFEFYVTDDLGEHDVLNISTKECGIHLIFDSDFNSFIRDLDLDLGSKGSLASKHSQWLGSRLGPELWLESQHSATLTTTERERERRRRSITISDIVNDAFKKYLLQLQLHPLRTKAITAAVLAGFSDAVTQKIAGAKKLQLRRLLLFVLYGFTYSGPFGHYFHKLMDKLFKGQTGNDTVAKVILEQVTSSPWNNFFFMMYYGLIIEGRPWSIVMNKVRKDYPSVQLTAWKFWPIVAWVNYQYMPLQFRVIFHSFVAACWGIFLNLKARSVAIKKA